METGIGKRRVFRTKVKGQVLEAISKLPSYILNYHILLSAIIEQAQ